MDSIRFPVRSLSLGFCRLQVCGQIFSNIMGWWSQRETKNWFGIWSFYKISKSLNNDKVFGSFTSLIMNISISVSFLFPHCLNSQRKKSNNKHGSSNTFTPIPHIMCRFKYIKIVSKYLKKETARDINEDQLTT